MSKRTEWDEGFHEGYIAGSDELQKVREQLDAAMALINANQRLNDQKTKASS